MARLVVDRDELVLRLSWWERLAVRRREVRVPVGSVREVAVERDWWRALRGVSAGGVWIPGALCVGTRRHPAGTDFVAVRPRRPVLRVDLHRSSPLARLAVSVPDPEAEAGALRARLGR